MSLSYHVPDDRSVTRWVVLLLSCTCAGNKGFDDDDDDRTVVVRFQQRSLPKCENIRILARLGVAMDIRPR